MASLPTASGPEAIRAFNKVGFVLHRVAGSHHIMKREGHPYVLSVPVHGNKPVKKGTLRSLISVAGLTVEGFCDLLG